MVLFDKNGVMVPWKTGVRNPIDVERHDLIFESAGG
jgi:hypothetical protein